ncbi:MAG: hypothetical protein Q4D85_14465 [Corynebacterium sp.]|uniref:hypothetical protein n=1 Tax=Corynebacterium sp. TaxID=1720 RepID=UPI0026DC2A59|nr:hypothetical protein [Corynebacterium sp.]MDO5099936.1 hypothetical protein [Corynebacterium sp.]
MSFSVIALVVYHLFGHHTRRGLTLQENTIEAIEVVKLKKLPFPLSFQEELILKRSNACAGAGATGFAINAIDTTAAAIGLRKLRDPNIYVDPSCVGAI